jgi:hypothetical protein
MKEDRRGYSSVDSYDDGKGGDNNNSHNNNKSNAGISNNYTDYITSRHSSSFDAIEDNSATLPRSNIKNQKHGGNNLMMLHQSSSLLSNNSSRSSNHTNSSPGGAVVELSSLFRTETDRRGNLANYTSNNSNSSNNENENGEDGDDEMNSKQRRRRKKKNNLVDKGSMNMNSTPNSVTSAAAKK